MEVEPQERGHGNLPWRGVLRESEKGREGAGQGHHQEHQERRSKGDEGAEGIGVEGSMEGPAEPQGEDEEGLEVHDDVGDEERGEVEVGEEE